MQQMIQKLVENHSLNESEAQSAMNKIMEGSATEAQIGSFLTALRMKGETPSEIAGFARVMIEKARRIHPGHDVLLDTCGTGGDHSNTFNISTAAAFVVAGAGIAVVKHGNRSVSSKCGSADVLEALGVNLNIGADDVEDCINRIGIGFLFAPLFHQAMKNVVKPRKEVGIRTVFNVLGPLVNPARATHQVIGVYAEHLTETLAQVLQKLGTRRALVVHGSGLDEITICGETKITEIDGESLRTYRITPGEFDIPVADIDQLRGGDSQENAGIIQRILDGEQGAPRDIVLLNSAAAIYTCGHSESMAQGLETARKSIDSGAALEKLNALISASNEYGN